MSDSICGSERSQMEGQAIYSSHMDDTALLEEGLPLADSMFLWLIPSIIVPMHAYTQGRLSRFD
jgi:hypothetical protein